MGLGPFDLTGGPFLQLYCMMFAIALAAGWVIPRWLRPEGQAVAANGADELAVLAGGTERFADAVVARLLAARAITLVGKQHFFPENRGSGRSAAERDILTLPAPIRWPQILKLLGPHAAPITARLTAAGLLMDDGLIRQMRFWQSLPYLLLFGFGAIKWQIGLLRDRPVGILTVLLIATAICAAVRWARVDRRTRGGLAALAAAQERSERLRRAPVAGETDLAVALFGTVVLAGSGWGDFHLLRTASSGGGDGGSGGSGGDGGGGGCGGGGCGGCGS